MRSATVAVLALALLTACEDAEPDKPLSQTAAEINTTLPKMIDSQTRLDRVEGGPDKTFDYYFTLVDATADTVDRDAIKDVVPKMKAAIIGNRDTGLMLRFGITITHHYRDRDGNMVVSFSVTPSDLPIPEPEAEEPVPAPEEVGKPAESETGTFLIVVGWVVWGAALLVGLGSMSSSSPDGGVRSMMRTQGLGLLAACAVTLIFPISKIWLLLAFPLAFLLPMFLMSARAASLEDRVAELQRESEATGVPLVDLLERETKRMQGEE